MIKSPIRAGARGASPGQPDSLLLDVSAVVEVSCRLEAASRLLSGVLLRHIDEEPAVTGAIRLIDAAQRHLVPR